MATKKASQKELQKLIAQAIKDGTVTVEQLEAVTKVKASAPQALVVSFSEYEGNPLIVLKRGENGRPFSFGIEKAKMIVEAIKSIESFINDPK